MCFCSFVGSFVQSLVFCVFVRSFVGAHAFLFFVPLFGRSLAQGSKAASFFLSWYEWFNHLSQALCFLHFFYSYARKASPTYEPYRRLVKVIDYSFSLLLKTLEKTQNKTKQKEKLAMHFHRQVMKRDSSGFCCCCCFLHSIKKVMKVVGLVISVDQRKNVECTWAIEPQIDRFPAPMTYH